MSLSPEDIAALRRDGDLESYLRSLAGAPPSKPAPAEPAAPDEPDYVIPHRGAWPIGSAVSGPTPTHGKCTCPRCATATPRLDPPVDARPTRQPPERRPP